MCELGDLDALAPERYIVPKPIKTVNRNKSLNQAIADTILVSWKAPVEGTVIFGYVHDMSNTTRQFHVYFLPATQSMFEAAIQTIIPEKRVRRPERQRA